MKKIINLIAIGLALVLSITCFAFYIGNNNIGMLISGFILLLVTFVLIGVLVFLILYDTYIDAKNRLDAWSDTSYHVANVNDDTIENLDIGFLTYKENAYGSFEVSWANNYLKEQLKSGLEGEDLFEVVPNLESIFNTKADFFKTKIEDKYFKIEIKREINGLYFFDITEFELLERKYDNRINALAMISIENLEQASKNMDISEQQAYLGEILKTISDYFTERGGYLQNYDDDQILVVLDKENVKEFQNDKFSILDKVKSLSNNKRVSATLAIGVACFDTDALEVAENAKSALRLAEKRGGDQAVVNVQNEEVKFYGGKTNAIASSSLSEARNMALELKKLVDSSSKVYIMGHYNADADCFGSMLAILNMCLSSNKDAYIVLENERADETILPLIDQIEDENNESKASLRIISRKKVNVDERTLLIICDTQSPNILMFKDLYEEFIPVKIGDEEKKRVVVIDHHRVGDVGFDNIALSYVSTSASSTVELVTEMLQFYGDKKVNLTPIEATCMLAGIVIDTNNFTFRTTERTYEVASIILSFNADMILVKTISRLPFEREKEIATAVMNADIYLGRYAIASIDSKENDRSFLAQIADKLMTISGIDASFVIGNIGENLTGISARSYGKINVQVLMEQMDGGGHLNNAATQVKDKSVAEVKEQLIEVIKNNEDEDDKIMKVILLQDVKGKGKKNAIIDVANGYGNYLLTNKLAIMATDENIQAVNDQIATEKDQEKRSYEVALKTKEEIESKKVTVYIKLGADGKAFGHVTTKAICEELEKQTGIQIDKRRLTLPSEINSVGLYKASYEVYKDVKASLAVNVEKE